jgi:hypothetical protein
MLQDAIPGDPQRAWQRRPKPVLIDLLHFAPESTMRLKATHLGDVGANESRQFQPSVQDDALFTTASTGSRAAFVSLDCAVIAFTKGD